MEVRCRSYVAWRFDYVNQLRRCRAAGAMVGVRTATASAGPAAARGEWQRLENLGQLFCPDALRLVFATAALRKSGGERAALQTLRAIRGPRAIAPAFGVRWL